MNNSAPSRAVAPPRAPETQRLAKPKRLKAHTVLSKSHSIPVVPRDKKGNPLLPLNVGIMTVINLGEVCKREHFHTERYIFPVGYEVTRCADPVHHSLPRSRTPDSQALFIDYGSYRRGCLSLLNFGRWRWPQVQDCCRGQPKTHCRWDSDGCVVDDRQDGKSDSQQATLELCLRARLLRFSSKHD